MRLVLQKRDTEVVSTGRMVTLNVVAILLSLVIPGIVIAALGVSPLQALKSLFLGAWGSTAAIEKTLIKMAPLLTAAIGVSVAFRAGLWSIGNLGQFLLGALGATVVALALPDVPGVWVPALLGGALFGALWAFIPGILRARWSVNEVITTLMMNSLAVLLINYLVSGPLMDRVAGLPQSPRLSAGSALPPLIPGSRVHFGVLLALIVAAAFYLILFRTSLGYEFRVVGKSPRAANYSGVNPQRTLLTAMLISGSLSGLAGAGEVLGLHHRLLDGIAGGYEYTPIIAALLGALNPLGNVITTFVFGGLLVGARATQVSTGLPISIVQAIQALIVLFVLGAKVFEHYQLALKPTRAPVRVSAGAPSAATPLTEAVDGEIGRV